MVSTISSSVRSRVCGLTGQLGVATAKALKLTFSHTVLPVSSTSRSTFAPSKASDL